MRSTGKCNRPLITLAISLGKRARRFAISMLSGEIITLKISGDINLIYP